MDIHHFNRYELFDLKCYTDIRIHFRTYIIHFVVADATSVADIPALCTDGCLVSSSLPGKESFVAVNSHYIPFTYLHVYMVLMFLN